MLAKQNLRRTTTNKIFINRSIRLEITPESPRISASKLRLLLDLNVGLSENGTNDTKTSGRKLPRHATLALAPSGGSIIYFVIRKIVHLRHKICIAAKRRLQ